MQPASWARSFWAAPFVNPLLLEFTDEHIRPVLEIGAKMKVPFGAKFFGLFLVVFFLVYAGTL